MHNAFIVTGTLHDAHTVTLDDPNGRPQYLVEERELIRELL